MMCITSTCRPVTCVVAHIYLLVTTGHCSGIVVVCGRSVCSKGNIEDNEAEEETTGPCHRVVARDRARMATMTSRRSSRGGQQRRQQELDGVGVAIAAIVHCKCRVTCFTSDPPLYLSSYLLCS